MRLGCFIIYSNTFAWLSLAHVDALEAVSGREADVAIGGALGLVLLVQGDTLREICVLGHARAGSVLGPLMTPEVIVGVGRLASGPVLLHIRQGVRGELGLTEDLSGAVGARALGIRPKTVDTLKAAVVLKSQNILGDLASGSRLVSSQISTERHSDKRTQHNENHAKGHSGRLGESTKIIWSINWLQQRMNMTDSPNFSPSVRAAAGPSST